MSKAKSHRTAPTPRARESKPRARHATNGTNGHSEHLIAVPHVGPGRKRMVPAESIDGLAVRLANEMAAHTVGQIRTIIDAMVKRALEDALGKF